jgi:tetratricopeptide (TPR) repeat protein
MLRAWATAFVLMLSVSAHAAGDDDMQARALLREAQTAYDVGQFELALERYTAAYKLKALPGFLFNMGQCQRQLGRAREAAFLFGRFLDASKSDAPNVSLARELKADMEAKAATQANLDAERAASAEALARAEAAATAAAEAQAKAEAAAKRVSEDAPRNTSLVPSLPPPPPPPLVSTEPVTKKPWFWVVVGGAATAVAAGVVTAVVISNPPKTYPMGTLEDINARQ